ncbi:hypothetical protein APY06_07690 [Cutibacterium avidum]|nr:hypothetical protein APY06_07690 [Cutibacterium avidum]
MEVMAKLLFNDVMKAVYPHLRGTRNTADFMRNMIERLCAVPEEHWFTPRGRTPDQDYKDESLRKFYSRGITKKLARAMLANPTRDNFVDSLNYVDDIETQSVEEVKAALARSIQPFTGEDVDDFNVGDVLFDLIQQALEFVVNPELENDRKLQRATAVSDAVKGKLGSRLLEECKYTCSRTGCGKHLQPVTDDGATAPLYAIGRIEGEARTYENLVALCPDCFHAYTLTHKKSDVKDLRRNKKAQVDAAQARKTLTTVDIERGISKVVEKLGNANPKEFEPLNFDPVAVKDKIDQSVDVFVFDEVFMHVTRYFRFIEKELQEQAQLKTFDDGLLRAEIRASYTKLADKGYAKQRIHEALTIRLSQITKQDARYCAYVTSYFVQSCEVFDAAS